MWELKNSKSTSSPSFSPQCKYMSIQQSFAERTAALHRSEGHTMSERQSLVMPAFGEDLFILQEVGCPSLAIQKKPKKGANSKAS